MVRIMRHRQTKGPDTDRPNLNHRVTSRLYTFGVVIPNSVPPMSFLHPLLSLAGHSVAYHFFGSIFRRDPLPAMHRIPKGVGQHPLFLSTFQSAPARR